MHKTNTIPTIFLAGVLPVLLAGAAEPVTPAPLKSGAGYKFHWSGNRL